MKINVNITYFGHYSYLALRDNIEMLENSLLDCGINTTVSKNIFKSKINIFYEGIHPNLYNDFEEALKKNKQKKYLILTEELTSHKFLPKSFFTFNNHEINRFKYKKKNYKTFFKLLHLNIKIVIKKIFEKKNIERRIQKIFKKFDIGKILNLTKLDIKWKDRYNFFYNHLNKFEGFISTYDSRNYKDLKLKKYIFFPQLFSKNDLKFKKKENRKKFDIIFTGRLNNYRSNLINKLKKKFKVKVLSISDEFKRNLGIKRSKLLIGLFKDKKQNLSSTNRTFFCIKNRILLINQTPILNDHLDNSYFMFKEKNIIKKFEKILNDYDNNKKNYLIYCEKKIQNFQAIKYKKKIKNFFKNNI